MISWKKFASLEVRKELRIGYGALVKLISASGTETTIDLAELAALDSIGAADLAKIDGITNGTGAAGKAVVLDSNGGASVPGVVTLDGNKMATEAAVGITGGTGTVYKSSVIKEGGIIKTKILLDLRGLGTSTTDLDIVGQGASAAHLGQITAARNGTIIGGTVTCLETPATGSDDLDLYSATEATGKFDDGIAALTETALLTRGAAWAAGDVKPLTAVPAANSYLYLTNGEAGTVGTFSAGRFLIELHGY